MAVPYGTKTWPMKAKHEVKLDRSEINMIRWMGGFSLNERKKNAELREMLVLLPVSLVIKKGRLR